MSTDHPFTSTGQENLEPTAKLIQQTETQRNLNVLVSDEDEDEIVFHL